MQCLPLNTIVVNTRKLIPVHEEEHTTGWQLMKNMGNAHLTQKKMWRACAQSCRPLAIELSHTKTNEMNAYQVNIGMPKIKTSKP